MARYRPWTPRRAARFGYLAGRGLSADAIGNDPAVGAVSHVAVRHVATRWEFRSLPAPPARSCFRLMLSASFIVPLGSAVPLSRRAICLGRFRLAIES
jgi:hypothetical protein